MYRKLNYILLLFIIIISGVCATTVKSNDGSFKISYPDIVNPFEPFTVHVEILKNYKNFFDKTTDIKISSGSIPLSEGLDFNPKSDLPIKKGEIETYIYSGEKKFDIEVSLLQIGGFNLNDMFREYKETSNLDTEFSLRFWGQDKDTENVMYDSFIIAPIKSYKYNISIDLPTNYIYQENVEDLNILKKTFRYDEEYSKASVVMMLPITFEDAPLNNKKHRTTLAELESGLLIDSSVSVGEVIGIENYNKDIFEINDYPAAFYTNCEVNCFKDDDNECQGTCKFIGQQATDIGIIRFEMDNDPAEFTTRKTAEKNIIKWKEIANSAFRSIKFSAEGDTKDLEIKSSENYVYGHLTNKDGNPLPYMLVEIFIDNKKEATGYTDLNGNYKLKLENLNFKDNENLNAIIIFDFNYIKDNINYFKLYSYRESEEIYKNAQMWKNISINPNSNLELNINIDGGRNIGLKSNFGSHSAMNDYATIYYGMHESIEFATEKLFQKLDHNLPIKVLIGKNDDDTYYSPIKSKIYIAKSDQSYYSSNNPRNREYHEFGHHLMYDTYGSWTGDSSMRGTINHGGFINPTTADSFDEGFAEYTALCIAKYMGYNDADIYGGFGSMEDNYKPWDGNGKDEEFAIASLLWDLIDSKNEPGDSLTMSIEDVWRVIGIKEADMFGYYKSFIKRFPDKKDEFDKLFILHGFFADTKEGNGKWDRAFEPFKDVNQNHHIDSSDIFVDLSCNKSPCKINYKKGMIIGQATNFDRPDRSQAVRIDNSYIKVDINGPRYYKLTVNYDDVNRDTYSYIVEAREGLVYVHPRPDNVKAIITIEPETKDYTFKKPYIISNSKLVEYIYSDRKDKYFDEPDFGLESLNTNNDPEFLEEGFEPKITNDLNRLEKKNDKIINTEFISDSSFPFEKFFIIILATILIYIYIKKPIIKKNTNKFIKKILILLKKIISWFINNIIPITNKYLKLFKNWISKIYIIIYHKSKKIHNNLKPKIKLINEKLKNKIKNRKK